MNNNTHIAVYHGDQPAHAHERRAINVVRNELARRNVSAILLVNFTVARGARQIDLLIVTDQRCMNVELKHVDTTLPLIATLNGPWRQLLDDGTERMVADHNYYEQAIQETYGITDAFAYLSGKGLVPGPTAKGFARHIDTVVCCDPHIPAGSTLNKRAYVTVAGLDTLIDRLAQPGPGLPHWDRRHWDEVIRYLGLYVEGDDSAEALRRRADAAAIADYRRHFREFTAAGLSALVPAAALIDSTHVTVDADAVADRLTGGQHRAQLTAESGQGKTHLARHTALALTDRGQMVVWIDADDYRKGQLIQSLRRAVSPHSTHEAHSLLAKAAENGAGITVVVDALEKCPHPEKLIEQLHSLQNQYSATILVTTTGNSNLQLDVTCDLELQAPTGPERARIATTYGTSDRVADSEEYRTRYDITVAAQVISELAPGEDSNTEVLDAYINRRTPNEAVRAGLRCLAQAMNTSVRTALPISEAMTSLRRCEALATTPSAIDDILASPVVRVRQGRLRFDHDKLARFLAAQHLVLTARDGVELAQLLTQPAHRDLRDHAIVLETDPSRRYDTIRELADPILIAAAAQGAFGVPTAKQAHADITELLVQATAAATHSTFTASDSDDSSLDGTWNHLRQWTPTEVALLLCAGRCAYNGMFLNEIGALMDATDTAMRAAMRELHKAGHRLAISTVVACTYGLFSQKNTPAAGLITRGAETALFFGDRAATDVATATFMWQPNPRCFGRLYLAALLSHPIRHDGDAQNLPDLVETGLAAGGYHLRLKLLEAAQYGSSILKSEARQRMIDVLCSYDNDPRDVGTNSTLIEVLASYDQITPVTSLEGIQREITAALSDVDNPEHQALARGIVTSMFEDERILGPYSEAVDSLSDAERLTLCAMSVMPPGSSFATPWAVKQLADGMDLSADIVQRALARYAGPLPHETFSHSEDVEAHLSGLSGWAKISATLPPAAESTDPSDIAWRLVDELLVGETRGAPTRVGTEAIWRTLSTELPGATALILRDLYRADSELLVNDQGSAIHPHRALTTAYPDQIRHLLERALTHRDELPAVHHEWDPMGDTATYAVRVLGRVGNADTADLLRHHYVHDPQLGHDAIEAVHAIDARISC
ncbi:MAG: hypothetical protein WCE30_07320 [Mycobacterium sp.]